MRRIPVDQAVALYESGLSTIAVGAALGFDPAAVYRVLTRAGVEIRHGAWNRMPVDVDALRAEHAKGTSTVRIAALLGIPREVARHRLMELGLPANGRDFSLPMKPRKPRPPKPFTPCVAAGCTNADLHRVKGACDLHYARMQQTGSYGPPGRLRALNGSTCSVAACTDRIVRQGFCPRHWRRFEQCGDPLAPAPKRAPRFCAAADCGERHWAQDYCRKHYKRWAKYGTPELPVVTGDDRFWAQVDRRGPDECWPWTGATVKGYGHSHEGGSHYYAHRRSYEMHVGPIPDGLVMRHRCDNPPCVNPAHLEVGTMADNVNDMISRGRGHWQKRLGA